MLTPSALSFMDPLHEPPLELPWSSSGQHCLPLKRALGASWLTQEVERSGLYMDERHL